MRVARNLYLAFAVAAALALPSPPGCVSASSTSPALDKAHAKGQRLMEKGRYDAAIKHLRKAE